MRATLYLFSKKIIPILSLAALMLINFNCKPRDGASKTLFRTVAPTESGITFNNTLKESEDFNIIEYLYFYNGGGVAVAMEGAVGRRRWKPVSLRPPSALYCRWPRP